MINALNFDNKIFKWYIINMRIRFLINHQQLFLKFIYKISIKKVCI